MKNPLIIPFFLVLTLFVFPTGAAAQVTDSLPPWAKLPEIEIVGTFEADEDWTIMELKKQRARVLKAMQTTALGLPAGSVKRIDGPITLQRNGECVKIGIAPNGCDSCQILWYDANGDGKIQPRKELRCLCRDCDVPCKLRARQVECNE